MHVSFPLGVYNILFFPVFVFLKCKEVDHVDENLCTGCCMRLVQNHGHGMIVPVGLFDVHSFYNFAKNCHRIHGLPYLQNILFIFRLICLLFP